MKTWMFNQLVIASVLVFLISQAGAGNSEGELTVPEATDFALLSLQSSQQDLPILIMYAAEYCEYCERLEAEVLGPMHQSGQYLNQAIIRKVMIDRVGNIRDFNGQPIDAEKFADDRGVQVTPTLHFVDARGNQLVPAMVGYNTPEMYAGYVENAISKSRNAILSAELTQ
ncbi:MAG: thioredoxin fold domain-containing protein [Gammaproteobacteria bacterium]|jgi:thioredoxin-related protein